jgi:polysaccharide biosynthesis protein PslH
MKILQLCNKIPFPPVDGGSIAILNISQSFALEGHEVHILAMSTEKHYGEVSDIPEQISAQINFHYVKVNTSIRPIRLLLNLLFSGLPYNAQRFDNSKFRKALHRLLIHQTFDVVQLEGLYLKPYISLVRELHTGLLVYRAHNIEHAIWQQLAFLQGNKLKKIYLGNLAKRIKRYEAGVIDQYDLLVPISNNDAAELEMMGNTKPACVIPVGIIPEKFRQITLEVPAKNLFFIGSLDWIPNLEALCWFIDTVWIDLMQKYPSISFHIAGRNTPVWIEKKYKHANVVFHGEVADSNSFMDKYDIMVVPLFAGSGIRVKIIEGMARSKIVVTTRLGAQGLNIADGTQVLLAEKADDFKTVLEGLLNNVQNCREIQKNAFSFAYDNYSSDKIIKKLIDFYKKNIAC